MLKAAQRFDGQGHADYGADLLRPCAGGVDKTAGRQARARGKAHGAHCRGVRADSGDLVLDVFHAERARLAPETLQQTVGVAPTVLKRMHARGKVVDGHGREARFKAGLIEPVGPHACGELKLVVLAQHALGVLWHDEQIAALVPVDVGRFAVDGHMFGEVLDKGNAEIGHGNILRTGELPPCAARGPWRRGELVSRIRFDDRHRASGGEDFQEVGDARARCRTADDDDIVFGVHASKLSASGVCGGAC